MKEKIAAHRPQNNRKTTATPEWGTPTESQLQAIRRAVRQHEIERRAKPIETAAERAFEHFIDVAPTFIRVTAKITLAAVLPLAGAAGLLFAGFATHTIATAAIAWAKQQDWIAPSLAIIGLSGLALLAIQYMRSGLADNRERTRKQDSPGQAQDTQAGQPGNGQTIIIYQNQTRTP